MAEIRQKIISCPNGHYYDASRYASCPHCGASAGAASGGFSETLPPNAVQPTPGAAGGFSETLPPNAVRPSSPSSGAGGFSETLPPQSVRHGGGSSSSKFSETVFVDNTGSSKTQSVAPVVGWLITMDGDLRGTDYRIHSNYNYIGREVGDICIHGDKGISAERDTSITYVAKTQCFYIAHEQGKNVLLVNDEPVVGGNKMLREYDLITIGNTTLLFVPLCGPKFNWEDGVVGDE